MALHTLGTNANTSLSAIVYGAADADADVATLQQAIFDDFLQSNPITGLAAGVKTTFPGAFTKQGLLFVPNRGYLKPMPGDVIAFDVTTGFPILIPANTVTNGPWHFV